MRFKKEKSNTSKKIQGGALLGLFVSATFCLLGMPSAAIARNTVRVCAAPSVDLQQLSGGRPCVRYPAGFRDRRCRADSVVWNCPQGTQIPAALRYPAPSPAPTSTLTASSAPTTDPFQAIAQSCPQGQFRVNGTCAPNGEFSVLPIGLSDNRWSSMGSQLFCVRPAVSEARVGRYTPVVGSDPVWRRQIFQQCPSKDLAVVHPTACHTGAVSDPRRAGTLFACRKQSFTSQVFNKQVQDYRRLVLGNTP
jgi:hypothetical protein